MGARETTIYEVAARAGVSISTVSLTINHPERVAVATRERVLAAVDETGFVPAARAVAQARSRGARIALLAPFTSYPSFGRQLAGALDEVKGTGVQLVVYDHEDVAMSASPLLSALPIRGNVDALVIMGVPVDDVVADRLSARLPTVLVGSRHPGLSDVWTDDAAGGALVGARLQAWGHRRVAFVRESELSYLANSPTQRRVDGLRSAVGDAAVREVVVTRGGDAGAEVVAALTADPRSRPTAIFANRDVIALSVVSALRRAGLRVPQDVSVVGYDDGAEAEACGLTTVTNPLEESGRQAVRVIRQQLEAARKGFAPVASSVELPVSFRERDSAARAPGPARV